MLKRKTFQAALPVLTVLILVLGTTPASAVAVETSFRNYAAGQCLDYRADWGVYVTGCNGGNYQKWRWNTHNAPTPIRQIATGKCLMLLYSIVTLETCNDGEPLQWWWVQPNGAGQIPFIKSDYNGRCVEWVGGRTVGPERCESGNGSQRWRIR